MKTDGRGILIVPHCLVERNSINPACGVAVRTVVGRSIGFVLAKIPSFVLVKALGADAERAYPYK